MIYLSEMLHDVLHDIIFNMSYLICRREREKEKQFMNNSKMFCMSVFLRFQP